jgi:GLPGLI family protein
MKYLPKFLSVIFFLFCSVSEINAQTEHYHSIMKSLTNAKILDSGNIKITYSSTLVADSSKPDTKLNDIKILLIGDSIQHFYSYYARYKDSVVTSKEKGKGSASISPFPPDVFPEWYHIYSNYPTGKQTVCDNISIFQAYAYNEDLVDFPEWSITTETMTVLNYLCYKATCHYHGRNWEAWFTFDIPINTGPWKLRGLPGLILKANDDRQHYVFECSGIEKRREPIIMYERAYKDASNPAHTGTRKQYLKDLRKFYENYVDWLLINGSHVWLLDDSGKKIEEIEPLNTKFTDQKWSFTHKVNARDRYKKIPYNPIELE